ncbi:MAG: peroxidase [Pelagibacterales bacterium]|nr:peroxidase [Pelagibacterales bacterium]|tara:strand:- start:278 stop:937 length:660 start_codon:yes stop_codon:yes gene_type:complete
MLRINEEAPNFQINTTHGEINFHNWIGDGWAVLFSHPKDFTPVCTTELGTLAKMADEFKSRNCKIIGLSVDSIDDHNSWKNDIEDVAGATLSYPLIADENLEVAKLYNMLPIKIEGNASDRTAVDNLTVRSVFLIGPDKRIKMSLTYPMSSGRDFFEILRVLDSCQLTANYKVATPANWKSGDDVIIVPAVDNEEAKKLFPEGWTTVKPYLRTLPDPRK